MRPAKEEDAPAVTKPIRLSAALLAAAEREGRVHRRSAPKQIEFWAELGKSVAPILGLSDVMAVLQGFAKIKVELAGSQPVDVEAVVRDMKNPRTLKRVSERVTSAGVYYEPSATRPGFLDKVTRATGKRVPGRFSEGEFKPA